jgi:hypothetical protein
VRHWRPSDKAPKMGPLLTTESSLCRRWPLVTQPQGLEVWPLLLRIHLAILSNFNYFKWK